MSRIGKKPIAIPSGVTITIDDRDLTVKGSKGELKMTVSYEVELEIGEKEVEVKKVGKTSLAQPMWGTTRALIQNMIQGVSEGFKKQLELQGVGYKMAVQGKKLNMNLGFSHPVEVEIPEGLAASIEKDILTIEGINKQQVGQFAAEIRAYRPVEPYKGKGFRYVGEQVIRKEGKKAVGSEG